MRCDRAREAITDRLMDSLDSEATRELEIHLESCEACRAESESIQKIWNSLGRIPAPAPQTSRLPAFVAQLNRNSRRLQMLRAAAIAILVIGAGSVGYLTGARSTLPAIEDSGNEYLLLLRGTEPENVLPGEELVERYSAWAGELASDGILLDAEKLSAGTPRYIASDRPDPGGFISGFFLIRASDLPTAERIARNSPHVALGGTVELREVDSTD